MSHFSNLIEIAKSHFPNLLLEIEESVDWRSGSMDHRFKLRRALVQNLLVKFPNENHEDLLDLKKLPQFKHGFISISHCPKVGAYAVCNRQLGLDIEIETRVRPEIVERICQKKELSLTNNYSALWSAKEALFKAHRNLKMISETQILDWNLSHGEIFRFNDLHFTGWVHLSQGLTVALAIKNPST
jgi:hypothetical protein